MKKLIGVIVALIFVMLVFVPAVDMHSGNSNNVKNNTPALMQGNANKLKFENIQVQSYHSIASKASADASKLGMKEFKTCSTSMSRDGITVTLQTTRLTSQNANENGVILTSLYNGEVTGSILLAVHNFKNSNQYTFIPIFSTVLKHPETINASLSSISPITPLASNSINANTVPDAYHIPVGTYSSGWLGWAYSFNNYNTQGLIHWLEVGAGVSFFIILLVTLGVGLPVAAIIVAALAAAASVLGLINWMGGYQGIYFAESANWIATYFGYPVSWISYNPVPGGY
jgi:hypothetical protein